MDGWSEEEILNPDLMAPCGLYCGVCGVYIATRDDNEKFRTVLGKLYGTAPGETACRGCMQAEPAQCLYGYCRFCAIRDCIRTKGLRSCHACADWPCREIQNFPLATGRRVMERAIPLWRSHVARLGEEEGSVAWAREECERCRCPACGKPLFRGAQRCRACGESVAKRLDGSLQA